MSNIDPSIIQILSLLNTSAAGKKQAGNIGSMIDFLSDPWLGVLTGGYDPLSGVESQASRPLMDQIANDPDAPPIVGSIARAIAEGQPIYKVNRLIRDTQDRGGYGEPELKAIAADLASEDAAYRKASSSKSDMFSKAGLPAFTERYSDRPELAPLSADTQSEMQRLFAQASKLKSESESGRKKGKETAASEKKQFKDVAADYADKPRLVDPKTGIEYTQSLSANVKRGDWKNPLNWLPNIVNTATQAGSRTVEDVLGMSKKPGTGGKPKSYSASFGDLSKKKNLENYLRTVGAEQEANRLAKQAEDLRGQAIAAAEAQGRTPLMDMLATRILASRLMGA